MIKIDKEKKGICISCSKPAIEKINDFTYCAHCGDKVLMAAILTCVKALEEVNVQYTIHPKIAEEPGNSNIVSEKQLIEKPVLGIFYMVPDPVKGKYIMLAETEDDNPEPAHFFMWESVLRRLHKLFSGKSIDLLEDDYIGLPRGRIGKSSSGDEWYVLHGNDFPLDEYREEILKKFRLIEADSLGKVILKVVDHEKMGVTEKRNVESTLGITLNRLGFTVKSSRRK